MHPSIPCVPSDSCAVRLKSLASRAQSNHSAERNTSTLSRIHLMMYWNSELYLCIGRYGYKQRRKFCKTLKIALEKLGDLIRWT